MEKSGSQAAASSEPFITFVQTDTSNFREVVQRLTGPSEGDVAKEVPAVKVALPKRPTSKLHERRQCMRPKLEIAKPPLSFKGMHSPSISGNFGFLASPVGTPSTIFSKLSIVDEENKESAKPQVNNEEEEKAIRERGFYLHPSPRSNPGYNEPELLNLFPLTSSASEKP